MNNEFLSGVFKWLFIGLLVTFGVGYISCNIPLFANLIFAKGAFIFISILELVLAAALSLGINKMNKQVASICYIGYAALTGVTFSSLFMLFGLASLSIVFLITSIIFGIFAFIGKTTKINLSGVGLFLFIGLISLIILNIINQFILSNTLDMISIGIALIVFLGYTAYDVKIIVNNYDNDDRYAIYGAFQLYLDFINLFINLLKLFSRRRND